LELSFASVPGRTYRLQQSEALGSWLDTGVDFPAHPTAAETIRTFPKPVQPAKFYRVRVVNDWQ
jgi:hypothetical protein